jgi:hypothetical protein
MKIRKAGQARATEGSKIVVAETRRRQGIPRKELIEQVDHKLHW